MRNWDLITGAARLELAHRNLLSTWEDVREQWDDLAATGFQEKFLLPLEPRMKRALEAIKHLSTVLAAAQREIEPQ